MPGSHIIRQPITDADSSFYYDGFVLPSSLDGPSSDHRGAFFLTVYQHLLELTPFAPAWCQTNLSSSAGLDCADSETNGHRASQVVFGDGSVAKTEESCRQGPGNAALLKPVAYFN
ncbi:hypothetical protein RRG08_027873 [Elysia crispata]|uniref:Uncharacterized protein n=1 Tax=Elysia crispata TaxID=231223 RepID=A0AAE1DU17_9GAST|nr:hypothetical protein RRG08_027873 [Elysia crispata]